MKEQTGAAIEEATSCLGDFANNNCGGAEVPKKLVEETIGAINFALGKLQAVNQKEAAEPTFTPEEAAAMKAADAAVAGHSSETVQRLLNGLRAREAGLDEVEAIGSQDEVEEILTPTELEEPAEDDLPEPVPEAKAKPKPSNMKPKMKSRAAPKKATKAKAAPKRKSSAAAAAKAKAKAAPKAEAKTKSKAKKAEAGRKRKSQEDEEEAAEKGEDEVLSDKALKKKCHSVTQKKFSQ